jgi:transcriptional regulator with XRE-family HTH domain
MLDLAMSRNASLPKRSGSGWRETEVRRRIGSRIAALREERKWSQAELARRIGVGRTRLGKWETGEHVPHVTHLITLKGAFGVSLDELVEGGRAEAPPLREGEMPGLEKAVEILSQWLRRGLRPAVEEEQHPPAP